MKKNAMKTTIGSCLRKVIDVLNQQVLMKNACGELAKVFGKAYLRKNYGNTLVARGMSAPDTFMLFVGIKDSDDLPDRKANEKGWVVYGKVLIDAHTGNLKDIEYVLE